MSTVLVIAPHPDDETLGCGGTLLKHKAQGDNIHWLIITAMLEDYGFSQEEINKRQAEINNVTSAYSFDSVHQTGFPAIHLDPVKLPDLVGSISKILSELQPDILYVPYLNDVHTDHQISMKAIQSCIKRFRYPFVKKVLMYETVSETHFNFVHGKTFCPNVFNDVECYIDRKVEIMHMYPSEIAAHPFPRSEQSIRALSTLRGSQANFNEAEAFELVFECL